MCYDIKTSKEAQLKRAERKGDAKAIEEIKKDLLPLTDLPLYHKSGFSHPKLLIYTDRSPNFPEISQWGLVPHWVKDNAGLKKIWNNTLNARGETIFELSSFKNSAKNKRCIVYVDGFYEHHHYNGNTFPFYVYKKDKSPMALAGLWSEWVDKESGEMYNTFSIVTTLGNKLMGKIHNNPKLEEPRMPVILPLELEDKWLETVNDELDIKELKSLLTSYPEEELDSHTVKRLRGKEYEGNVENISEKFTYPDLIFS